ncbi:MAG: preprotein translocase subunit SecG [Spirochaetota bacterium]
MAILSGFLLVVFIITAVLLVIIVLMQEEGGEGLGGIFGGGGAAPVGNRSGNILTRATAVLATIFLVSLFGYAWINRNPEQSNVEAAARALEAEEGEVLEWWRVDEPVELPESEEAPAQGELQNLEGSETDDEEDGADQTGE